MQPNTSSVITSFVLGVTLSASACGPVDTDEKVKKASIKLSVLERKQLHADEIRDLNIPEVPDATISKVELVTFGIPGQPITEERLIPPADGTSDLCRGFYISDVVYEGRQLVEYASSVGCGPGRLSTAVRESVTSSISASFGVDTRVVSASVGYSIGVTWEAELRKEIDQPSHVFQRLTGYIPWNTHRWNAWYDSCIPGPDTYLGVGRSSNFERSVVFVTYDLYSCIK